MSAQKLAIRVTDRTLAHHIAAVLSDLFEPPPTAVTVFENGPDWLVEAYYDGPAPDAGATGQTLAEILGVAGIQCASAEVPDENWVAKSQAALPPVLAGRFSIYGSHDRARVGRGWNTIQIDAGEAFGTAHHATTYGCLLAISELTRQRSYSSILDLGTGSGVLALAVQRAMPQASIIATDLDQRSIEVARDNAAVNAVTGGIDRRLQFYCTAGLEHPDVRRRAPFDLVVANILAGPLIALAPEIARHVCPGGAVVLSGILERQAAEVAARYCSLGFSMLQHGRYEDWATLVLERR